MQHSVTEMGRAVRRRLERVVHKSRDKDYARRALAILHLWESEGNVAQAADRVRAARSSVYRWQSSFETYGEEGLCPQPRGRSDWKANDEVLSLLETIVEKTHESSAICAHVGARSYCRWSSLGAAALRFMPPR